MKTIIVEIASDGTVTLEANGFTGPACMASTRFLEDALGQVRQRRHKPEYQQRQNQAARRRQDLGGRP